MKKQQRSIRTGQQNPNKKMLRVRFNNMTNFSIVSDIFLDLEYFS